jgi:hypothetical protein
MSKEMPIHLAYAHLYSKIQIPKRRLSKIYTASHQFNNVKISALDNTDRLLSTSLVFFKRSTYNQITNRANILLLYQDIRFF